MRPKIKRKKISLFIYHYIRGEYPGSMKQQNRKSNNSVKKQGVEMNRFFLKEEVTVANRLVKKKFIITDDHGNTNKVNPLSR